MKQYRKSDHPLADSQFMDHPLETHPFEHPDPNAFNCALCNRPRALHETNEPDYQDTMYRGEGYDRQCAMKSENRARASCFTCCRNKCAWPKRRERSPVEGCAQWVAPPAGL